MITRDDVARLRLIGQRLAGPPAATAADAVRWLLGVQAQDHSGALCSVALRTASHSRVDVVAALDAGEVVRSWPMRGTLHLTAASDLPWMLRVLAPRAVRASVGRQAALGLDDSELERGRKLAVDALAGGRRLRRSELFGVWAGAGLDPGGQRGIHILRHLAMTASVVLGPTADGEQLVVAFQDWIPRSAALSRDEALGQLAVRYFSGHGPAAPSDLAAWAGLTAGDVKTAVALARPFLATMDVDGVEHLLDPRTPDRLADARGEADGVLLLPGFDEFLLGYRNRSAQLPPAWADRVVPGGNGMFRSTVVSAGQVVGTWIRTGRGAARTIEATPFTRFPPKVAVAIPDLFAALP